MMSAFARDAFSEDALRAVPAKLAAMEFRDVFS